MVPFHLPQQVFHLQSRHHVKAGEGLIQQDHRRSADEEAQHLDLVFHAVGVAPHEPVSVVGLQPHQLQPLVRGAAALVLRNLLKELHKLGAGEKFRHHRGGQHIADVPLLGGDFPLFKGKAGVFQHLFGAEGLGNLVENQLHGNAPLSAYMGFLTGQSQPQ